MPKILKNIIYIFVLLVVFSIFWQKPAQAQTEVLKEINPVASPTNDITPEYTFFATATGTLVYGGICQGPEVALAGENIISFNELIDGIYDNCTIILNLDNGSSSAPLLVSPFIVDTISPEITLLGSSTVELELGEEYIEPGLTATDNIDGNIMEWVHDEGSTAIDVNIPGNYFIVYNVSDSAGNAALTATRTVIVLPDTDPPIISLIGSSTIELEQESEYSELGASSSDEHDGDLTEMIQIGGDEVDNMATGTYIIIYSVIDAAGNEASTTRTVIITPDVSAPDILGLSDDQTAQRQKSWHWWSTDTEARFRFAVNQEVVFVLNGEYGTTSTTSLATGNGVFYLHVQAIDNHNNESEIMTVSVTMDNIAPQAILSNVPSRQTHETGIDISVSGSDVSEYKYKLDSGAYSVIKPVAENISLSYLSFMEHTIYVIAGDEAGNWQPKASSTKYTWTINRTTSSSGSGSSGGNTSTQTNDTTQVDSDMATSTNEEEQEISVAGDITAPINFQAERSEQQVYLTWRNPQQENFKGVLVVRGLGIDEDIAINDLKKKYLVYDGSAQSAVDRVNNLTVYYYAITAYDSAKNYSPVAIIKVPAGNSESENMTEQPEIKVLGIEHEEVDNLAELTSDIVNEISDREAQSIQDHEEFVPMDEDSQLIYESIIHNYEDDLGDKQKIRIAYFIYYGTPTTKRLGAGERAGSLDSYVTAFGSFPQTQEDWQDVVKIANGRWPNQRNEVKENEATEIFSKIYLRQPDINNVYDNAAVTVLAYGLRPAERNLESEKKAIIIFKDIFGYNPKNATDWDSVRAIAYSGAIR